MSIQPLTHADGVRTSRTLRLNSTDENFLFCFKIKKLSLDCFCGLSLRSGMKVSAAILFFIAISSIYSIFKESNYYTICSSIVLSILYFAASYYIFVSAIHLKEESSQVGYYILCTIFYIDLADYIFVITLTALGFFDFYLADQINFFIFGFILFGFCVLLTEFYILWVVFNFKIHLKLKNTFIVTGDSMKDILEESLL